MLTVLCYQVKSFIFDVMQWRIFHGRGTPTPDSPTFRKICMSKWKNWFPWGGYMSATPPWIRQCCVTDDLANFKIQMLCCRVWASSLWHGITKLNTQCHSRKYPFTSTLIVQRVLSWQEDLASVIQFVSVNKILSRIEKIQNSNWLILTKTPKDQQRVGYFVGSIQKLEKCCLD